MYKYLFILMLCLSMIPYNAADIVLSNLTAPGQKPAETAAPTSTEPAPAVATATASDTEKSVVKDVNPPQVPINPDDFFKIVDKNEPKEENPVQETVPVEKLPQLINREDPVKRIPAPEPEPPRLQPKFITGTEPREDEAPGVQLDPNDFFKIVDKNEPKEENPVPVTMDPNDFFQLTDKNLVKDKGMYDDPQPSATTPAPKAKVRESVPARDSGEPIRVDPDAYEPDNSASQYTTITVHFTLQTQNHTLHTTTGQDWYRFYAYTGRDYHFYSTGTIDTDIYLYEDNGTTLLAYDWDSGAGTNYDLVFTPTTNGYYKLKVVGYNGGGNGVGAYVFCYIFEADPDIYEPDNSASQFTTLFPMTFDRIQNHTLHSTTDEDWYRFYGISGMTYTFWSTGNTDSRVYLYEDDGTTQLAWDDDSGTITNFSLPFAPTAHAWYKLKVNGYAGAVGAYTFYYTYTAPADSYEPDNSASQYTWLYPTSANQIQDHTLHSDTDQDWFRFYGYTGRYYTFYSTYNTDTVLYLYQDNGTTLIDWDDDDEEGLNFYLQFAPTATAYYKLKVVGYSTGYYGLNYSQGADPDSYEPDNSPTQYTAISVTSTLQTQNHTIHSADDEDWFRFYAFTGRIYNFYSTGNTDTRVFLYEDNGTTLIDWDDDDGDGNNFSLQFAPTANAYYKLKVDGFNIAVGAYVFNYLYGADPDSYEPDNSSSQYTWLNPDSTNQTQNHTLHNSTDQDWYRFYGYTGRIFNFHSTGNTDTVIYLYQDNGTTLLASDDQSGAGNNFLLEYEPTANAYYKLKVVGFGGAVGAYVFNYHYYANPDAFEPDDSAGDPTEITVIGGYTSYQDHTLHNTIDQDWFRFHGTATGTYEFWSTGNTDTVVYLYQDNGTTLIVSDDQGGDGNNFHLTYTIGATAWYKLKVVGYYGAVGAYRFYYTYTAPADGYEPDNTALESTWVYPNTSLQSQSHTIHDGTDVDWFKFYAYAGRIYSFYSAYTTDTVGYLYASDGTTLLLSNDDYGGYLNFRLDFAPTTSGNYYLKVAGYGGFICGFYDLFYYTWAQPDSYEPDNSATQFTAINVYDTNHTQNHTLHDADDQDWFRFYAYAGRIYQFYSTGNTDTRVYLYEDNGTTQLGYDDDDGAGLNFLLDYAPSVSGFYKLKVDPFPGSCGAYVLNYHYYADPDAYEPDNSATEYTAITPTTTLQIQNHTLHSTTDEDWFRFQGVANRTYTFYSTGNTDTYIHLYQDNSTTQIAVNDDSGSGLNFHLEFVPTATAYYKLKVIGFAGDIGAYAFCYSYSADLTAPANVNISITGTTLTIQWNAVTNATSYRIEASDNPYTGFVMVGTSTIASWSTSASAARKFYRIIALN